MDLNVAEKGSEFVDDVYFEPNKKKKGISNILHSSGRIYRVKDGLELLVLKTYIRNVKAKKPNAKQRQRLKDILAERYGKPVKIEERKTETAPPESSNVEGAIETQPAVAEKKQTVKAGMMELTPDKLTYAAWGTLGFFVFYLIYKSLPKGRKYI